MPLPPGWTNCESSLITCPTWATAGSPLRKKDKQLVAEFHKVAATYRRPPDGFGEDFSVTFSDAYGLGFILQPAAAGGGKTSDRIVSRLEWAGIQPEEVNDECVGVVKAVKAMFPATAAAAEEA